MRWLQYVRAPARVSWLQVVKTSVAIAVSWAIAVFTMGVDMPIFAAIAALLVVAPSVNQSIAKGIERTIGAVAGVALAALVGWLFGDGTWIVLALVVVTVVLAWMVRLPPMASNQVPISAMLALSLGVGHDPNVAVDRIVETMIGAAVALVVNLVLVPPIVHAPARKALAEMGEDIATAYEACADALVTPEWNGRAELLAEARALRDRREAAVQRMQELEESLQMNPRAKKVHEAISRDRELLRTLTILTNRVIGIARAIADRFDDGVADEPLIPGIAQELRRIGHDIRLLQQHIEAHDSVDTDRFARLDPPALTAPIVISTPNARHWVLMGFLLESIRQVRESLKLGFTEVE